MARLSRYLLHFFLKRARLVMVGTLSSFSIWRQNLESSYRRWMRIDGGEITRQRLPRVSPLPKGARHVDGGAGLPCVSRSDSLLVTAASPYTSTLQLQISASSVKVHQQACLGQILPDLPPDGQMCGCLAG